jgi:ligand-binding sensor domain-containing protein
MGLMASIVMGHVRQSTLPSGWSTIRPPHDVMDLVVLGNTVWAGGKDGLYALDRRSGSSVALAHDVPRLSYVRDLFVDRGGRLLVAHSKGVSIYDGSAWQFLSGEDAPLDGPATALAEDELGRLWVGGEGGVVCLAKEDRQVFTARDGLGLDSVDVIFADVGGILWFGSSHPTRGGLSCYDGTEWQVFASDALIHPCVNAIMQQRDGTLWIGTGYASRGGAIRVTADEWTALTVDDGLAGAKVRSLFEDQEGSLWFGSEYNGLAICDGENWCVLGPADGLADFEVRAIAQDTDGVMWIGTANGITRIRQLD